MGAAAAPRADRPAGCAGVSGFAGYAGSAFAAFLRSRSRRVARFALTGAKRRREYANVAAQSATGIGVPNQKAHQRPSTDARRFFIARIVAGACRPVLWRAVRGGRKAHRVLLAGTPTAYRPPPRLASGWRIPKHKRNPACLTTHMKHPRLWHTRSSMMCGRSSMPAKGRVPPGEARMPISASQVRLCMRSRLPAPMQSLASIAR